MSTAYGTVKHKYNKNWIYLNPNPALGPFAWNVAKLPDVDGSDDVDIENLYTVPPIMNNQIGDTADLYFSIQDLKDRSEPDTMTRTIKANIALLLDSGSLPPSGMKSLRDVSEIRATMPVQSQTVNKDVYLWFDIFNLPEVETIRNRRRYTVRAGYNSRSVTSLTANRPLEVDNVDGLATVSFDITTLPDA